MNFKDDSMVLVWSIFQILLEISGQWSDLTPGELPNAAKRIGGGAMGSTAEFNLGPFESFNDQFYLSEQYVGAMNLNHRGIVENLMKSKYSENSADSQREQRKSGIRTLYLKEEKSNRIESDKTNFLSCLAKAQKTENEDEKELLSPSCKALQGVLDKLRIMKNQVAEIKKLSVFLDDFAKCIDDIKTELLAFDSDNLFRPVKTERKPSEVEMSDEKTNFQYFPFPIKNVYKFANNFTRGQQYQIGNVFIFNELRGKTASNLKNDGELEQKQDNVNVETSNNHGDLFPAGQQHSADEKGESFSKIFTSEKNEEVEDVSLEQIRQMSKIIDFVERYHGVMSLSDIGINDLSILSTGNQKKTKRINNLHNEKFRGKGKVKGKGKETKQKGRVNRISTIDIGSKKNQRKGVIGFKGQETRNGHDGNLNSSNLAGPDVLERNHVKEQTTFSRRKGSFLYNFQ